MLPGGYQTFPEDPGLFIRLGHVNNLSFVPHMHKQYEFCYVNQGRILADVAGERRLLEPGDLCFAGGNQMHSYETEKSSECLLGIVDPDFLPSFTAFLRSGTLIHPFARAADISADKRMTALISLLNDSHGQNRTIVAGYLTALFTIIALNSGVADSQGSLGTLAEQAVGYLAKNYGEQLTLAQVAGALNVSPGHLSRLFNKRIGYSFPDYIAYLRISAARSMLLTTNQTVSDIAWRCGFESARSFNRTFKDKTGVSPTEFRHRERKD